MMSDRPLLSVAGAAMSAAAEKIARVMLSTLKQRGWTDGAVRWFLGEPHALVMNPNYRSGPRMRLYDLPPVEATERSERWRAWFDKTRVLRAKASAQQSERMNAARGELAAQINAVEIRVPRLRRDEGAGAIVIENLDFVDARTRGREKTGNRPSRGRKGRRFRRQIAGIPTAKFRDRLTQMASNTGLAIIVVDPAYTSKWAAQHWLAP
ncbi:hypothetical protein MSM1_01175 [Mycobacterium sp. SM1]|uniref:hypothetical protein n=1 Tax=Mycobacterium sp. SM1 TaxID=2816243 RepID=UPI001BD1085B|nr:hypothetical protein [Mycobacterium sp. SM1]MBS4727037.1 hypothetical protein [Mycobacterium sp. SM1]